jgi:hypothetical protein
MQYTLFTTEFNYMFWSLIRSKAVKIFDMDIKSSSVRKE